MAKKSDPEFEDDELKVIEQSMRAAVSRSMITCLFYMSIPVFLLYIYISNKTLQDIFNFNIGVMFLVTNLLSAVAMLFNLYWHRKHTRKQLEDALYAEDKDKSNG